MKQMTSLERTLGFIEGRTVDRVPFHPILMRFAARYAGVRYRDFCLSAAHKCMANIKCATDFRSDWVNTMSDPYAEAEAFGTVLSYPDDDLPKVTGYAIKEIGDIDRLKVIKTGDHRRMSERLDRDQGVSQTDLGKLFHCRLGGGSSGGIL